MVNIRSLRIYMFPSHCLLVTHIYIVMIYALCLGKVVVQHKINVPRIERNRYHGHTYGDSVPKRRKYALRICGDMTQKQDPHQPKFILQYSPMNFTSTDSTRICVSCCCVLHDLRRCHVTVTPK
jgi:hypothetical protein